MAENAVQRKVDMPPAVTVTTQRLPALREAPTHQLLLPEASPEIIEQAMQIGDIKLMSPQIRVAYYIQTCLSIGLNPYTQPFDLIEGDDGKVKQYPNKSCAEQIRKRDQISLPVVSRVKDGDLYIVTVKATTPNGREEEAQGIVSLVKPVGTWKSAQSGSGKRYFEAAKDANGQALYEPLRGTELANAMMKAECCPLDSEILTRAGWKTHEQVKVGEEVLAYDCDIDQCAWTPLEAITVYPEALTMRFGTELHAFRCTPDHSWAVANEPYRLRGVTPRGPYRTRRPVRMLAQAYAVTAGQKLILAAPAEGGTSPLTPAEAAVLGWVMTDGTIRRRAGIRHSGISRVGICQSKEEQCEEIETVLTGTGYTFSKSTGQPTTRHFGTHVSECLPQTWWYLSAHDSRALFQKAGIDGPEDMPGLVTRLSCDARKAMFAAMMAADGDSKGRFGKKRKPGVMESWQILATLEGYALGKWHEGDVIPTQTARKQRFIAGRNLALTDPLVEAVWCPTTRYGTWIMRQGHHITITGNTKAKRRATFGIAGLGFDEDEPQGTPIAMNLATGALTPETARPPVRLGEAQKPIQDHITDLFGDDPRGSSPSVPVAENAVVTPESLPPETPQEDEEPARHDSGRVEAEDAPGALLEAKTRYARRQALCALVLQSQRSLSEYIRVTAKRCTIEATDPDEVLMAISDGWIEGLIREAEAYLAKHPPQPDPTPAPDEATVSAFTLGAQGDAEGEGGN